MPTFLGKKNSPNLRTFEGTAIPQHLPYMKKRAGIPPGALELREVVEATQITWSCVFFNGFYHGIRETTPSQLAFQELLEFGC